MRIARYWLALSVAAVAIGAAVAPAAMLNVGGGVMQAVSLPAGIETPTPTPVSCGPVEDASLKLDPDEIEVFGPSPLPVSLLLANEGEQSHALDVVLALSTLKGEEFMQSVELPDGTLWAINGAPSSTVLPIVEVPLDAPVEIPLTIHMTESWSFAAENTEAKFRVEVEEARCTRVPPPTRVTVTVILSNGGYQQLLPDSWDIVFPDEPLANPDGSEGIDEPVPSPGPTPEPPPEPAPAPDPDTRETPAPSPGPQPPLDDRSVDAPAQPLE